VWNHKGTFRTKPSCCCCSLASERTQDSASRVRSIILNWQPFNNGPNTWSSKYVHLLKYTPFAHGAWERDHADGAERIDGARRAISARHSEKKAISSNRSVVHTWQTQALLHVCHGTSAALQLVMQHRLSALLRHERVVQKAEKTHLRSFNHLPQRPYGACKMRPIGLVYRVHKPIQVAVDFIQSNAPSLVNRQKT
jgi:hypothetical protein